MVLTIYADGLERTLGLAVARLARVKAVAAPLSAVALAAHSYGSAIAISTSQGVMGGARAVFHFLASMDPEYEDGDSWQAAQKDMWLEVAINQLLIANKEFPVPSESRSNFAEMLDTYMSDQTYLVGHRISYADLVVCLSLHHAEVSVGSFVHTSRWMDTILNHPAVRFALSNSEASFSSAPLSSTPLQESRAVESTLDASNRALDLLQNLGIQTTTVSHVAAMTVEEQSAVVGHLPGVLTKNLLLRDKKHGLYLIVTTADREYTMTSIGDTLNLAKHNFRMADEETLQTTLGVGRGSVSALAVINDTQKNVHVCLDSALIQPSCVCINLHPLTNTLTSSISPEGLLQYLNHLGHEPIILDFNAEATPASVPAKKAPKTGKKSTPVLAATVEESGAATGKNLQKETHLSVGVTKEENFSDWYRQTITLSELVDYGEISGCYVLRPWSFAIWEAIQSWFDAEIKKLGVSNAYFPLFVTKSALEKEKDHVEGFAPEVAWVTKSGDSELPEPIAIRPTSETIMYPLFKKWIRSHRDLPLCLNQWTNVVRWEFKDPTPFLRSREFLWQEGHTAHATYEESQTMVLQILDLYRRVYEELLAVPVIKGMKTENEKFAGGYHTTTVEAYINGSGRAIQGATSHNLGQNFGKMFQITFEDESGERLIPWQTSWGITTRTIGVCVMVHGDDKGLVLPPRVAPKQAVIIPIIMKNTNWEDLLAYASMVEQTLTEAGVRVEVDSRQNYTAGWKFNHWEQKGVPLRLEVGPKDMEKRQVKVCRRDNGEKADVAVEALGQSVLALLDDVQTSLLTRSREQRDSKIVLVYEWSDFVPRLNEQCLCLTPFCDEKDAEDEVKKRSREEALEGGVEDARTSASVAAKTLCKPFDPSALGAPSLTEDSVCFFTGRPAKAWVLWGRSY